MSLPPSLFFFLLRFDSCSCSSFYFFLFVFRCYYCCRRIFLHATHITQKQRQQSNWINIGRLRDYGGGTKKRVCCQNFTMQSYLIWLSYSQFASLKHHFSLVSVIRCLAHLYSSAKMFFCSLFQNVTWCWYKYIFIILCIIIYT